VRRDQSLAVERAGRTGILRAERKTILKQAVWIDMLEFLSALLRVALLIPAAARTARQRGGVGT